VLPVRQVVGLDSGGGTIEMSRNDQGFELDLVTHDIRKFIELMLRKNGYVLEQLLSPLVVHTTAAHAELKELSRGCITRYHAHHYLGFAQTQWKLFDKGDPPRVKPLLYVYRVLLTGMHLMRTGEVEANLLKLNERYGLAYLADLVGLKLRGEEQAVLPGIDKEFHRREYERLRNELEEASRNSHLPEGPGCRPQLNDLLIRLRVG
jgi:hypothetical protein